MSKGNTISRSALSVASLAAGWILASGVANAIPITGSSTGIYIDPVPVGPDTVVFGEGTGKISWGTGQSSLEYSGIEGFSCETDQLCDFAQMTFSNRENVIGSAITGVKLQLLVEVEPLSLDDQSQHLADIVNTPNTDDPAESADIVTFRLANNFDLVDDDFIPFDAFHVFENEASTATLRGIFSLAVPGGLGQQNALAPLQAEGGGLVFEFLGYGEALDDNGFVSSIPEPAPLALLGVGLSMILLLRVRANRGNGALRGSAHFPTA